jgi:hypothetical protein
LEGIFLELILDPERELLGLLLAMDFVADEVQFLVFNLERLAVMNFLGRVAE